MFELQTEKFTGGCKQLYTEEIRDVYTSENTITSKKSRGKIACTARCEIRTLSQEKHEGALKYRRKNNIKFDFK